MEFAIGVEAERADVAERRRGTQLRRVIDETRRARLTGGGTSERGRDSATPHVRAVSDRDGRVLVVMTHNTDFGDAFEREGDSREYFERFAGAGYAFGVDTLLYAMTH